MIRAVFFDVFGTLMPYKTLPREIILSKRANMIGLSITPEQMKVALEMLERQNKGFAMAGQLGNEDVARDRAYWVEVFSDVLKAAGINGDTKGYATAMCDAFLLAEDFYLDDEALPTLRSLKRQGYLIGVISNAPKGLAATLEKFGLLPELDVVVGSQDVGIEKPDPRIFHLALNKAGVLASEAAYVGDEYVTDVKAAQAVGMLGIFLDRDGLRPVSDVIRIRRLSDLLAEGSLLHRRHP